MFNPHPLPSKPSPPPRFTVETSGMGYQVKEKSLTKYSSTYLQLTIQEAIDSLSRSRHETETPEKVLVKLNDRRFNKDLIANKVFGRADGEHCSIDSEIWIYSDTHLQVQGRISLADNSNCNMLENHSTDTCLSGIKIEGDYWYGNGTNQTQASEIDNNIFYWNNTTNRSHSGSFNEVCFVVTWDAGDDDGGAAGSALHINNCEVGSGGYANPVYIHDCTFLGGTTVYGFRGRGLLDSYLARLNCYSDDYTSFVLERATDNNINASTYFDSMIVNNFAKIEACNTCTFSNWQIEGNSNEGISVDIEESYKNLFDTWRIKNWSTVGEANPAIHLATANALPCDNNTFCNFNGFRASRGTTYKRFTYLIEEDDADQDFNVYSCINAPTGVSLNDVTVTGAVRQLGVNGKPRAHPAESINDTVILV